MTWLRLRWLIYGQFELRWRRWHCKDHEPMVVHIATLREFEAGALGRPQVRCRFCGALMRGFE